MRVLKEKISITIDSDIIEKIRKEAENDDRSLSQYINIILKEHIKNKKSIGWYSFVIDKQIGIRIRTQRELLGYTREELAEKLDVSAKFCSDIDDEILNLICLCSDKDSI